MADVINPEFKAVEPEAPKKKGRPKKKVDPEGGVWAKFTNKSNQDLHFSGFSVKSGQSIRVLSHIGSAIKRSPEVSRLVDAGNLVVS